MDRIASTEFQKRYPRLMTPHEVTAHGKVLGTWYPARARIEAAEARAADDIELDFRPAKKKR